MQILDVKDNTQKTVETKFDVTYARTDKKGNIVFTQKNNKSEFEVYFMKIKDLKIDESLLTDTEELADHLVMVLNTALEKAESVNEAEMKGAASGMMNMPEMDKFFK